MAEVPPAGKKQCTDVTSIVKLSTVTKITGLHPSERWSILLRVAVERNDDWIAEYWSTCLAHISTATDYMALACIDALKIYQQPSWNEQLFAKLREIEHSSTGDSLISAPIQNVSLKDCIIKTTYFFDCLSVSYRNKPLKLI